MAALKQHFNGNHKEIWLKLCEELDGKFTEDVLKKKVELNHGEWVFTLDVYKETAMNGITMSFTRMRAPYINKGNFQFQIYPETIFSNWAKILGMQDVVVGYENFDEKYVIKGDDENKLKALFANPRIRKMIEKEPEVHLEVRPDEGWFGQHFPKGVDELYFETTGIVNDLDRLKNLYHLFAEILNHLCQIDAAYEDDPGIVIK